MQSKRSRVGTRKWKKQSHKSRSWYLVNTGIYGINKEWTRNGKGNKL